MNTILPIVLLLIALPLRVGAADFLSFQGDPSLPGANKHIVLISGDEEYRSEESCPMLAKILSKRFGFQTTVLFAINPEGGFIDANYQKNIPGMAEIASADLVIIGTRFRDLPEEQMQAFADHLNAGKPVIGFRTATHAFRTGVKTGNIDWSNFGPLVLGEGWVNHYGQHMVQGARGKLHNEAAGKHPVMRGVGTIFVESDVYGIRAKNVNDSNATILLDGIVTETLAPDSAAVPGKDPQPIVWLREYKTPDGKPGTCLATTFGASCDFDDENLRRLIVNGCFHLTGLPVPEKADVSYIDAFEPSAYGFIREKDYFLHLNYRPADYGYGKSPRTGPSLGSLIKKDTPARGETAPTSLTISEGDTICLIGSGLGSRMAKFPHFETELHLRHPEANLVIRNLCDEGNTPGFRPQPGRGYDEQFAFPGAKELVPERFRRNSGPNGHRETPDQWLTRLEADTIIAFFGFNSSFDGPAELPRFRKELGAFLVHTLSQNYNGESPPQLALVSPTAFQDLSATHGTPDGREANANLKLYTDAMREVAREHKVLFVDLFGPTETLFRASDEELTIDGALLNDRGYRILATGLANALLGKAKIAHEERREAVHAAVREKNWAWLSEFKIPNGVHAYGRRYKPFGPQNYPDEIKKTREMTDNRDRALWAAARGRPFDLAAADAATHQLAPVPTNYRPGQVDYLPGRESKTRLTVAEGYRMELFASEKDFPNLANPCQLSFDNKGRLWVGTMASYPHYRIGDPRPQDKLLILEDTDGDGKADKETVFAGDLHIPIGFEIAPEGVYVSQSDSLVLLKDLDGDDRYDEMEYLMSGFDDHDTHHAISAFCADPSGALIMGEGVFLHSNVETAYGPVRGTNGGFFRYSPQRHKLTRYAQFSIPNPWGVAFDDYGQDFFLHTSGTSVSWMAPGLVRARYGFNMGAPSILTSNQVRPTSGIELVSSRHFPDEVQGDLLLNNTIGFLGAKQHQVIEDGTGFTTKFRQDLFKSKDGNFRPVDLEFAPDGSLYVSDWHNALIGHMQHNARDPHRDHEHGRIYRVTYPSRPLVQPATIAGAPIETLLENLKLPEYRTRYRTRRELRGRPAESVVPAAKAWAAAQSDERLKLEALWVTWGANQVDPALLRTLLQAKDHRVRAAAVRVLRFNLESVENPEVLLTAAAQDPHGRVRLEAITAASWLPKGSGLGVLAVASEAGLDDYSKQSHQFATDVLNNARSEEKEPELEVPSHLKGDLVESYKRGHEVYSRDGHCITCHQQNGQGLENIYPILAGSPWVTGSEERLIKLTLHGLMGPITVKGHEFPGTVPMTPFRGILNDQEIADVLTYVRNTWDNKATPVSPETVKAVRSATEDRQQFWSPEELLKDHPMESGSEGP